MRAPRPNRLAGLRLLCCILAVALQMRWAAVASAQEQEPGWNTPVSVSSTFPQSYLPDIAADKQGGLYVVWDAVFSQADEGWGEGTGFAMWDGRSWSKAVDITGLDLAHLPAIAVDSRGRVHVIGIGRVGLGYTRAWAQERPANAQAWSKPMDISQGVTRAYWNDIIVDSRDVIHVVFSDQAPVQSRRIVDGQCNGQDCSWVFYTRSTDGGDTWSKPVKISPTVASGARVMITSDPHDNLYVVWSTEWVTQGVAFAPSQNGFTSSLDGGTSWREPETQLFDTSPNEDSPLGRDYWLSIAVDSHEFIHVIATGSGIKHVYRQGAVGKWVDGGAPPGLISAGLGAGYGFRGVAVDSNDTLHFILPTMQSSDARAPSGLYHAVWNRDRGWSPWQRATTNTRGRGTGLGNVVVTNGNQLNVAWFEHLEGSAGMLFALPRGAIEIYYANLQTGAGAIAPAPLPTLPTPTSAEAGKPTAVATAQAMPTATLTASPEPSATVKATGHGNVSQSSAAIPPAAAGVVGALLVLAVAAAIVRTRGRKKSL